MTCRQSVAHCLFFYSPWTKNVFTFLNGWIVILIITKIAFLDTGKLYEIQISESTNALLLGTCQHSFIDMLSVAVFTLQWQRWVTGTETIQGALLVTVLCCSEHCKISGMQLYHKDVSSAVCIAVTQYFVLCMYVCMYYQWASITSKQEKKRKGDFECFSLECGLVCYQITWQSIVFVKQWHYNWVKRTL